MTHQTNSRGADLIRRRDDAVCRGVSRLSELTVSTAEGALLTDVEGREFIDFAGGIGVMNVGHCDPTVVAAIQEQAGKLLHTCIHVATYEPYVALCEKLNSILPHGERTKSLLVNTGAEAVENTIKIARQATERTGIICFTGAFHGRTLLCSTLTSKVSYKAGCGPFVGDVYRLPYPCRNAGEMLTEDEVADRALARLHSAFKDTVAPGDVAAIIIEPVQGEGGFHVAPKKFIDGLRAACDEHGIVLIFDEVQSGFCRTGAWGAYEHFGVAPDLSSWAKSLGGGMPIACVIGKAEVMDKASPGTLGGTYGGNPVACAAALATIAQMEALDLNAASRRHGQIIRTRFESIAERTEFVSSVRGLGAMMAVEFHVEGDPSRPATELVHAIITTSRERGLLVIPSGVNSNIIRVLAPLVISDEQLYRGLDILESAIMQHAASVHATAR